MKKRWIFFFIFFVVFWIFAVACGVLNSLTKNLDNRVNQNEKIITNGNETGFQHGIIPASQSPVGEDVYWNIGTAKAIESSKKPHIFIFLHGDNERSILYRTKFFYVKRKAQAARREGVNAVMVFPSSTQTVPYDHRWNKFTIENFAGLVQCITKKINTIQDTKHDPQKISVHLMGFSGGYRPMPNIALNSEYNISSLIFFDALYRHYRYAIDFARIRQGNIILVSTVGEPADNARKVYQALAKYPQKVHISVPQMRHYLSAKRHLVPAMILAGQMTP